MKRTIAPTLVALGLLATACTSGSETAPGPTSAESSDTVPTTEDTRTDTVPDDDRDDAPGPVGFASASLRQFDECSAFLDYVHTEGAERVGAYGFGDSGWFGPMVNAGGVAEGDVAVEMMEEAPASVDAAPTAANDTASSGDVAPSGGGDDGSFSTTNVQVAGVDEPDIVKTDGDRIVALTGETLHYVDVSDDGTSGTKRGSIRLTERSGQADFYVYGQEIFLAGDRVFVIGQAEGNYYGPDVIFDEEFESRPVVTDTIAPATTTLAPDDLEESDPPQTEPVDAEEQFAIEPAPIEEPPIEPLPSPSPDFFGPMTSITEVDVSNPDELRIVNTLTLEGRYISARSIGETARIAVTSPPQDLGFLYPSNPNATETALEVNRELIRNSTTEDWIPTYTLTSPEGAASTGDLVSCDSIHAPSEFAGFDMLSIVTLGLDEPLTAPTATTSVMATGDTVYASQDRLYVSTNVWLPPTIDEQQRGEWEAEYTTGIHRFSIAEDGPASYEASGSIEGHLLNQFSMNDRDGTFYVATTTGAPWNTTSSVSQIVAMQVNGDRLEQVGQVGGLGEGERIFSVRYVDDVAYVVTFRQTDPFYVVDLADPTSMTVLGELKIPGFSSYLHPITDTLVLGVGQDATDEGFTTGTKVSLFDVSDPGDPREVDVWTLPNGSSDAEFDHRAFLYWAETGTAVLPLVSYSDQFSGAIVLNVSESGLAEQGRITHVDEVSEVGTTDCRIIPVEELIDSVPNIVDLIGNGQLQLCGPDDIGGASGSYCTVIPVGDVGNYVDGYTVDDPGVLGDSLDGVDRIEVCYPDGGVDYNSQIRRTLIVEGNLWSLSNNRLQSNDLSSLDRLAAVGLPG